MNYSNLKIEIKESIALLTINRPDKLNALNRKTVEEIGSGMDELTADENVRGIIITGAGEKAFVAGADISEIAALDRETGRKFAAAGQAVFDKIEQCPKPVLAAVNGFALGGGCELAMACHMRFASENARFGQPEVNLGLIPGFGGTQRLPRLVGKGRALQLLTTGDVIGADEAFRIGLVNEVVPQNELLDRCGRILKTIFEKSPLAVSEVIEMVNKGLDLDLAAAEKLEAIRFGHICAGEDKAEGTAAFLEKRKPKFSGK